MTVPASMPAVRDLLILLLFGEDPLHTLALGHLAVRRQAAVATRSGQRAALRARMTTVASADFLTVPTATLRVLFVFLVRSYERGRVLHFSVTEPSTAEWTAQQMEEALPWDAAAPPTLRV